MWIGFEFRVVVDLASRQTIRDNASGSLQIGARTRAYGTCGLCAKRAPEGNVTLLSPCAPAEPLLLTSKMPLYGQYEPLIPDHFYGYQQHGLTRPSFICTGFLDSGFHRSDDFLETVKFPPLNQTFKIIHLVC